MSTATVRQSNSPTRPFATRVKLRQLSESAAAFHNAVRSMQTMDLSSMESGTVLELLPEIPARDKESGHPLMLDGPAGRLVLTNGSVFLSALTGAPPIDQFDAKKKAWLCQTAAALLPPPLQKLFTQVSEFGKAQTLGSKQDELLTALLVLRTADHAVTTHAQSTWKVWQRVLTCCQKPKPSFSQFWHAVPLSAQVIVGRHLMSVKRLHALSVGDIVIPEQPFFDVAGNGSFQIGTWHIEVESRNGPHLEIIDVYSSSSTDPSDNAGQRDGTSESEKLNNLQVNVQFELGTLTLSLDQLHSLSPGSVLSLQSPASPPNVRVLGGGRLLGKGELVDVNGQLGVQITSWAGQ